MHTCCETYLITPINYCSNNLKKLLDLFQSTNKRSSKLKKYSLNSRLSKKFPNPLNFVPPKADSPLNRKWASLKKKKTIIFFIYINFRSPTSVFGSWWVVNIINCKQIERFRRPSNDRGYRLHVFGWYRWNTHKVSHGVKRQGTC